MAEQTQEGEAIKTHGEQIAQCVDDMIYGTLGVVVGSAERREEHRAAYATGKEKLASLINAAPGHAASAAYPPTEPLP